MSSLVWTWFAKYAYGEHAARRNVKLSVTINLVWSHYLSTNLLLRNNYSVLNTRPKATTINNKYRQKGDKYVIFAPLKSEK